MIFHCPLCGAELREEVRTQVCTYCGEEEECEWLCPEGHFLCEACRMACPADIIERTCRVSTVCDPVKIADVLMKHPSFSAHGPEHHLLTAPVILAALRNQGHHIRPGAVGSALRRMKDIPVGVCGTRGDCGACVGLGCAVSLVRGATFKADRERSLALEGTARALLRVAELGGPRCCKQSVYATLQAAAAFMSDQLGMDFVVPEVIRCAFADKNEDCKKDRCPYFPHDG